MTSKKKSRDWRFRDNHLVYRRFCVSDFDLRDRFPEIVVSPDSQVSFETKPYTPPSYDRDSYISRGRLRISQIRHEEEQRRLDCINREKRRFAEDLSPDISLVSANLGIRRKSWNKNTARYREMNDLVKDIYERFFPNFNADRIYGHFLKRNESKRVVSKESKLEEILESLPSHYPKWKTGGWVSNSGCWIQAVYSLADKQDCGSPAKPEGIKVYACLGDFNTEAVFVDSLKHLLRFANDAFAAKIATCNRSDQICYWVSQNDFKLLEEFYKSYSNVLVKSLPFVAYKNHLGISKEFFGVDYSHNSTLAHIIADYLRTINDVSDVDLEDMFNHYIKKWNADIYEEDGFCSFKNSSALSFIVIMDSLDVILDDMEITDGHLLLSGDKHFWHTLSNSRCWADVNNKLIE